MRPAALKRIAPVGISHHHGRLRDPGGLLVLVNFSEDFQLAQVGLPPAWEGFQVPRSRVKRCLLWPCLRSEGFNCW